MQHLNIKEFNNIIFKIDSPVSWALSSSSLFITTVTILNSSKLLVEWIYGITQLHFEAIHKKMLSESRYGLTTLNRPKSREVSTNDGIITQNIFNAAVPTSS